MIDSIQRVGERSLIQHGKLNDRIYLMKLYPPDTLQVIEELLKIANNNNYSKIFCKIPASVAPHFIGEGYSIEGYVHGFYNQAEDALFVSRFFSDNRAKNNNRSEFKELGDLFQAPVKKKSIDSNSDDYTIRRLGKDDTTDMAMIYSEVFQSYPFPIHEPAYLRKTIEENVQYWGAFHSEKLVALASSEIDFELQNAEMTDFATQAKHLGHNLAGRLLEAMEKSAKEQNIKTLYTIARLKSVAMNKTFLRMGYHYSGTLLNNTEIAGDIESMNLYYKNI